MSDHNPGNSSSATRDSVAHDAASAGKSKLDSKVVQQVPISTFGDIPRSHAVQLPATSRTHSLMRMMDVPVSLVFEVGRTTITIADLMELREGSFIDLRNVSVDVIDIRANDIVIAEAEAISLQQRYGMRISEIEKIPGTGEEDE